MNARIRTSSNVLSRSEVDAHLAIVAVLDDVMFCRIDDNTALHRLWRPLEAFAPRCNCRRRLKFGPWRDGSRIVACACGVAFFEAKL